MTREDWEKQLDADPDDWSLRLAYSDWLEEQGLDVPAAGQRWMARTEKRPVLWQGSCGKLWLLGRDDNVGWAHRGETKKCCLPGVLFACIEKTIWWWYIRDSRAEAEEALARGLEEYERSIAAGAGGGGSAGAG